MIRVTPGFFDVFKVQAQLGRLLTADEQRPGGPPSVVITDAFWRRRFAARPSAIGATLRFSQRAYTIVGVLGRLSLRPHRRLRPSRPCGQHVAISAQLSRRGADREAAS